MEQLPYLNLGCGTKFHPKWVNVDMVSDSQYVIKANLLEGIPFKDASFDVVYHSQVLEHFPKKNAKDFIKECYRVLKHNGIIRIVVPDLENIVDEYKRLLTKNMDHPTALSKANYDWIMLEMYDQTVRNYSGGEMARYLQQEEVINEKYVLDRIGFIGHLIRNSFLAGRFNPNNEPNQSHDMHNENLAYQIGKFRLGGEVHLWMYDRYSLSRLLEDCGFVDIKIKNPYESDIRNWAYYELDVKNNMTYDPTSLFVEARK